MKGVRDVGSAPRVALPEAVVDRGVWVDWASKHFWAQILIRPAIPRYNELIKYGGASSALTPLAPASSLYWKPNAPSRFGGFFDYARHCIISETFRC